MSTRQAGRAPHTAPALPAENRTTVLLVHENADVRAYVRSVLAPLFRVIEAADGRAGLETARTALPDLIVADNGIVPPRHQRRCEAARTL